ncbi:Arc family DNA-binding protein [Acinetobacter sp. YQ_14]|uniref:Arc family DNA-binding protein n=1 Tax=Acinetobacter sp. YQ_14 TaxID=3367236 RepID=UPI00370C6051
MARQDRQINIRMPQKLVDELKKDANENRRSVTAQLNFIVEEWLKDQPKIPK